MSKRSLSNDIKGVQTVSAISRDCILPKNYDSFLEELKNCIRTARIKASQAVNRELITLYWDLGKRIVEEQEKVGWGKSVVEQLSQDLRAEFPGTAGFSARNLWDMRRFYAEYRHLPNLRQSVAEIPWGQNLVILNKVKDPAAREYYLRATSEMGWSRTVLEMQIESDAYQRHVTAPKQHTFAEHLPASLAEQADQAMKDVYALDFLGITKPVVEREIERRMVNQIRDVLLELGKGFTFIGNQYRVTLGDKEYVIDLLFFHRGLRCLVAMELKVDEFKPEYAGKMNFYLGLLNDYVRLPEENPSIGIILCRTRDRVTVEYALRDVNKPIGVAKYTLTRELPMELSTELPNVDELEARIMAELSTEEGEVE